MRKKEQAKEEDVLICARCGEQIIGDYDYVKTRRRTEMYFHKGLTCKAKRGVAYGSDTEHKRRISWAE